MSETEAYLDELRRALPIWCRRRLVAEVREHFASAAAAGEAEHVTIERLGPARAMADQLLADLRGGALGRVRRLAVAALTARRAAGLAAVLVAVLVVGAFFAGRHTSSRPPAPKLAATSPTVPTSVQVARLVYVLQANVRRNLREGGGTSLQLRIVPASH